MGIQDLQSFLEGSNIEGSCVGVDLVRIAKTQAAKWTKQMQKKSGILPAQQTQPAKFSIVVDAECCLDRLYGGYFSDWVCGGQWNRVMTFLGQFVTSLHVSNIELAVFFNGCTEPSRTEEWISEQYKSRAKINQVLRHLTMKGTPPPKVWWTPPVCLRPTLRMVLRNLNVPVFVTMDDHKQEVIAYCRENMCHAILADDAEYVAFNPPRYFSARNLKLTYKGTLESKEYIIAEMMKGLELSQEQLCILAALLGNFLLPESELTDLHRKLNLEVSPPKNKDGTVVDIGPEKVKAVAAFVRSLQSSKDLNELAVEIFGAVGGERADKFKQAVQYYLDGTKNGMFRFTSNSNSNKKINKKGSLKNPIEKTEYTEPGLDTSRLASEMTGNELDGLVSVTEAVACLSVGPEIVIDAATKNQAETGCQAIVNGGTEISVNGNHSLLTASSSGSSSGAASPSRAGEVVGKPKKTVRLVVEEEKITLPPVASEIMRTVSERHTKGLMSPLIYQILTEGEVKLPVVLEDECNKDIPSIQLFYRPLRMMVYAILFNLHHLNYMAKNNKSSQGEFKPPEIKIKEWIWSKANPYKKPEIVRAEPLGWGVPTVQRLWFGTSVDDKRRRLRAYLTCMRSDTQLMLNPSYVPQHLLILATVLRYMMSSPDMRVLRQHELDAIIAMAMDPHLPNSEYNQELQMNCISTRGIQIGAMIMAGIEYALLVNDTCGAPIPWLMTCPWLYFDGKLLHSTLARSATVNKLSEICNYRTVQVGNVERMREAILDGLFVQWALPFFIPTLNPTDSSRVHAVMPAGMAPTRVPPVRGAVPSSVRGRVLFGFNNTACNCLENTGEGYRYVTLGHFPCMPKYRMTTGGRLEIAGVVVGNWGPNCRLQQSIMMPSPQVTSVGGLGFNGIMRGAKGSAFTNRGAVNNIAARGKGRGGTNAKVNQGQGKKKSNNVAGALNKKEGKKQTRGRGMTAVSPYTGEVVDAADFLAQSHLQGGAEFEEKKRILTNNELKKPTKDTSLLLNGTKEFQENCNQSEKQFEDASNPIVATGLMCGANGGDEALLCPQMEN